MSNSDESGIPVSAIQTTKLSRILVSRSENLQSYGCRTWRSIISAAGVVTRTVSVVAEALGVVPRLRILQDLENFLNQRTHKKFKTLI